MKKEYYEVYINMGSKQWITLICEPIIKIKTKNYGNPYIFSEVITGQIIRPQYDNPKEEILNGNLGTLTYDNLDSKSYKKITPKRALCIMKEIYLNCLEVYQNKINEVANKRLIRSLSIEDEDTCCM